MAAGPTKQQISTAARLLVKGMAEKHAGEYVPATRYRYPEARCSSGITYSCRLIRASNGEAALIPLVRDGGGPWQDISF